MGPPASRPLAEAAADSTRSDADAEHLTDSAGPRRRASLGSPAPAVIAFIAVAALVVLDSVRSLHGFSFAYTDDDQSVYWFAAEEFLHFHFREPFFYGQAYNTLVESIPGALLAGLGARLNDALPVASAGFGLLAYLLLAVVAFRRGRRLIAVVILAIPLWLSSKYTFLLANDFNSGILLSVAGACVVSTWRSRLSWAVAGFLVGLGVVFNANSLLFAVPLLIYLCLDQWRSPLLIGAAAAGGVAALGLQRLALLFYVLHPGWNLHPAWHLQWSWTDLVSGLQNLDRFLGYFSPVGLPLPEACLAILLGLGVWESRRNPALAAAAFSAVAVALLALGINKVHDGQAAVFFSYGRMYLALPLLVGFALAAGTPALRASHPGWRVGLAAALAAAAGLHWFLLPAAVTEARRFPAVPITSPRTVAGLEAECRSVSTFARQQDAGLAVFIDQRGAAYGCGALDYGRLETLYPAFERRTWRLESEQATQRSVFVVVMTSPVPCGRFQAAGATCAPAQGEPWLAVVRFPARSALAVLGAAGVVVRPFCDCNVLGWAPKSTFEPTSAG